MGERNEEPGYTTRPLTQPALLHILDVPGREVLNIEIPIGGEQMDIDLQSLPAGVYMLRVDQGDQLLYAQKIIKH